MKRIGRVLSLFAGTAALTLSFAAPANAAPALQMPALPQLPSWASDLLPDGSTPVPAPAPAPAPSPAPSPSPAPVNAPCAVEAKACISLGDQTAWLQDGAGTVTRGPVAASTGRAGFETPVGTTQVTRKDANWWSTAYDAPMPFSVFFSAGSTYPGDIGIAFHEGDPGVLSHGCVHLLHDDAVAFFNSLQVGDVVDVVA
ncbi:MAG: L,D-transpeptidase [Corynebacterium sp.]|uniref:L,D-transpeptidase n=2 Tax=Corynebacterium TaxID=1716 RepID=UPI002649EA4D|nr:L,D-transpeptidase [Corynebacterium sp.]MDN5581804.1 L,D-transpeptidase [Corynebacterium sp.]MDN5719176.1 L,D-transpeptidase [Corynebacterium sp.]MDN6323950.1 L,D-transpeptidase [Corynebacterium sp.]MDN6509303.1 L,D-transpeptidase [Corynebacterium sp.]